MLTSRRWHHTLHFKGGKQGLREGGDFPSAAQLIHYGKGIQSLVLVCNQGVPLPPKHVLLSSIQNRDLWKKIGIMNVLKDIHYVNSVMSCHILSFPNFKFCQTSWLTIRKTLPCVFWCCVSLLICLSAWAIPEKAKSPTICCLLNTVESAFCLISAWRQVNKGYM